MTGCVSPLLSSIRARTPLHFIDNALALVSSAATLCSSSHPAPTVRHQHDYAPEFLASIAEYERWCDMGRAGKGGGYYAVQKGKQQGIFHTWTECEAATKGFSGAVFKKFDSEAAAQAFVHGNGYSAASNAVSNTTSVSNGADRSYTPYATAYSNKQRKQAQKAREAPGRPSCPASKPRAQPSCSSHVPQARVQQSYGNVVFPNASSSRTGPQRTSTVYCDGSSIGNGRTTARAGWGVFFEDPELHHLNESRRLPGDKQTNNRAELMALIRAVQLCPNDGRQLLIMTDSKYSMQTVTEWLPKWRQNGFKTLAGADVQNQDLIVELDKQLSGRHPRPKLEHVKAHVGIHGNEIVDRMAKYGASLPRDDSSDLSMRSNAPESHVMRDSEANSPAFSINISINPTNEQAHVSW